MLLNRPDKGEPGDHKLLSKEIMERLKTEEVFNLSVHITISIAL